MNEKKNAPSGAATSNEAKEAAAHAGTAISENDYTIQGGRRQGPVESLLLHGEANAIPTAQLVQLAGFRYQRELRIAIEGERARGALILSTVRGHGGYYLPSEDPDRRRQELKDFIHTVHVRAVNSQRALRAARQALQIMDGQEELSEW